MATSRHTIELNGQLYDAVTGELVASQKSQPVKVMDGFVKRKAPAVIPHSPVQQSAPAKRQRLSVQEAKPAPKPVKKSNTLMRSAVKKPTTRRAAEVKSPIAKKIASPPAHRLQRAITSPRSELVSKFGHSRRTNIEAKVAPLAVQAAPLPAAPPITDLRQQIAAVTGQRYGSKHSFDQALHQADSHKQPKTRKTKLSHRLAAKAHVAPRLMGFGTGLLVALVIAGFFWYQNLPNLSMRVASTKAGVAASLPGYKPAGFSMSRDIEYEPGQITVSYESNSDDREFELTQKKTDLSEQQLVDEISETTDQSPLTYQDDGKTIYIYNGSNAAWVEEGVLYQIEGDSALSSDQLIRLATSI